MSRADETLADFLDQIVYELVGHAAYQERNRVREEIRSHILLRAEDLQSLGFPEEESLLRAIREFGDPHQVLQGYAESFDSPYVASKSLRRARSGTVRTYLIFVGPALLCMGACQALILAGSPRSLLPWVVALVLASPVLSGFVAGWVVRNKLWQSVRNALGFTLIFAIASGVASLPHTEALAFACTVAAYWLPVGYLTACGGAYLRRVREANRPFDTLDSEVSFEKDAQEEPSFFAEAKPGRL